MSMSFYLSGTAMLRENLLAECGVTSEVLCGPCTENSDGAWSLQQPPDMDQEVAIWGQQWGHGGQSEAWVNRNWPIRCRGQGWAVSIMFGLLLILGQATICVTVPIITLILKLRTDHIMVVTWWSGIR
mgnify:CR=1 FL=1